MTFRIKNNKAIVLFVFSTLALYIHELYRLSLGCPRVLGECYLDGVDRYIYVYLCLLTWDVYFRVICIMVDFWQATRDVIFHMVHTPGQTPLERLYSHPHAYLIHTFTRLDS